MSRANEKKCEDWKDVKEKIIMRMVKTEQYKRFLDNAPFATMKDVTILFYVNRGSRYGEDICLIKDEDVKRWKKEANIEAQDIIHQAMENVLWAEFVTKNVEELAVDLMVKRGILKEPVEETWVGSRYFASTTTKKYGAIFIFRPDLMNKFADEVGSNFFITLDNENTVSLFPECRIETEADIERIEKARHNTKAVSNELLHYDRKEGKMTFVDQIILDDRK